MAESLFHEATRCVLKNWTALQLAIQHGMGGPYGHEKEPWMVNIIEQFYQDNDDLDPEEVEEYISEIMDNEFNTRVEDGSLREISKLLCQFFKWIQEGNEEEVRKRIPQPKAFTSRNCVEAPTNDDASDAEDEEVIGQRIQTMNVSQLNGESPETKDDGSAEGDAKEEEEEGWTVVHRRRR